MTVLLDIRIIGPNKSSHFSDKSWEVTDVILNYLEYVIHMHAFPCIPPINKYKVFNNKTFTYVHKVVRYKLFNIEIAA